VIFDKIARQWHFTVTATPGRWPDITDTSAETVVIRPERLQINVRCTSDGDRPVRGDVHITGPYVVHGHAIDDYASLVVHAMPRWLADICETCVRTAAAECATSSVLTMAEVVDHLGRASSHLRGRTPLAVAAETLLAGLLDVENRTP
jgi:hypothetical protein